MALVALDLGLVGWKARLTEIQPSDRFMLPLKAFIVGPGALFRSLRDLTARERQFLTDEILQARGLMPLLMKPRNKQRWTAQEKRELAHRLRRLTVIGHYLVVLALPGGMLMLPAVAWWLDRRRNRRTPETAVSG